MTFNKTDKIKTSITVSKSGHYTVAISQIYLYATREVKQCVFKQSKINTLETARAIAAEAIAYHKG